MGSSVVLLPVDRPRRCTDLPVPTGCSGGSDFLPVKQEVGVESTLSRSNRRHPRGPLPMRLTPNSSECAYT